MTTPRTYPIFQVDAFTQHLFRGNPACVVPLDHWPEDAVLLKIAAENAVPETAFFIPTAVGFHLRWFTPDIEMDLCGHATLATAHVIFRHLGFTDKVIRFESASGILTVDDAAAGYILDFPSRPPVAATLPPLIAEGIGATPREVWKARDYVLVFDDEATIRELRPDRARLDQVNLDPGGIIVTAPGKTSDFVSRFFTPQSTIFEDPVTGSAHCTLAPYWAQRLGKTTLTARQLSQREGELTCTLIHDRVQLQGYARTYLEGRIYVG